MARIVITIEDTEENKVKFSSNPSISSILLKNKEIGVLTSAEGCAILLARTMLNYSKEQDPDSVIVKPTVSY